ncbi:hypothetical protein I6A60_23410 [Frankia sp. AgB1.9]|uniref:hypothetical protein n=1 Tax=unclassified Frankia TaxID=2632575 RepID=UPI001934696B|nr:MULTISPECIES: hypothetical protein [unclassified Frankia]MBL7494581.1 hypothetical protein [Frankia sp. AgW1.1]MBL7550795.1 hypothetical protein [Frankia sp. AgB1.9]
MARSLRRVALWMLATGLAVLVSWFSVQHALRPDADVPRAVPVDRAETPSPVVPPVPSAAPSPTSPAVSASSASATMPSEPTVDPTSTSPVATTTSAASERPRHDPTRRRPGGGG